MAESDERQSLSSEIFNIMEKIQNKYLHWIFFALFLVFSLHLAGFELTKDFPYIQVSEDGMNRPLLIGLTLLCAILWLLIWRKKSEQTNINQNQQDDISDSHPLIDANDELTDHLESAVEQIEALPNSSIDPAILSAEKIKQIRSQRTIAVGLAEWMRLSRSQEKWAQRIIYEMNSPESNYSKYINDKCERLEEEIEACISALEESFRTHKRPKTTFKRCINAAFVYREGVKPILARIILESLQKSEELSYDSRNKRFMEHRIRDLKIGNDQE